MRQLCLWRWPCPDSRAAETIYTLRTYTPWPDAKSFLCVVRRWVAPFEDVIMACDLARRRKFTGLRYEYYVAARTLWFSSQQTMGAIMFGYAIECHLKHALLEASPGNKKVQFGHSLHDLFSVCREYDLFSGVRVSDAFIDYCQDNFTTRYPSQVVSGNQAIEDRGQIRVVDSACVHAFDDLVLQMDDAMRERFGDDAWMGRWLALGVEGLPARWFFHSNYAATKQCRLESYSNYLTRWSEGSRETSHPEVWAFNARLCEQRKALLAQPEVLMSFPSAHLAVPLRCNEPAKEFVYPGVIHRNDEGENLYAEVLMPFPGMT